MKNKKVGIVIIGRNEGERLILCLESVIKAQVPSIYVDSQSIDNSVFEAESRDIKTIVLDESAPVNASRARNSGFKALVDEYPRLEYIHFIDADCELDPKWLEHCLLEFESSKFTAVVCGRLHEKYKNKNIYTRLCDMDWYIEPGEVDACGGIATIRCSVMIETKGFNEQMIAGADPELYFRIRKKNYKIICLPVDMGTHDSNMQYFSEYWKRSVKTGYAYMSKMILNGSKKPVISAVVWAFCLPICIFLMSYAFSNLFMIMFLLYPVQVLKIYKNMSIKKVHSKYNNLLYATFCLLGKFAEFFGISKYIFNLFSTSKQQLIEYKGK